MPSRRRSSSRSRTSVDNRPLITAEDAMAFLKTIQFIFKDEREKYTEFVEIMKDYKIHQSIDVAGVAVRIKDLFESHPELILGFNAYLPMAHQIKLPEDISKPSDIQEAAELVSKIKNRLELQDYSSFLEILRNRRKRKFEVFEEVATLFQNRQWDLLEEFAHIINLGAIPAHN